MRPSSGDLFPTDKPVEPGRLIGREDDVRDLAASLVNGTDVVITGPRRTGKTSVCDAALDRARKRGCYTVAIDLFEVADAAELAEAIVSKTVANRGKLQRFVHVARQKGRDALGAAGMRTVLAAQGELGEDIEIAFTPNLAARAPDRYLDFALRLPDRVAEADGKRLVFFFDEFQEIAASRRPYGDTDALTRRMRAIFQRSKHVSFLFAGSLEHLMRDLFAPEDRALSQFGGFRELTSIEPEEWKLGLRERFGEDDCSIDDVAVRRLVELGSGHPRATMLIAQQAHVAAVLLDAHEIDASLVETGHEQAVRSDRLKHQQTVQQIRAMHKHALRIARRVARAEPLYRDLEAKAASRATTTLRNAGLIERAGRGWDIIDPLLRRYLADLDPTAV
jgi:hypothetical protein